MSQTFLRRSACSISRECHSLLLSPLRYRAHRTLITSATAAAIGPTFAIHRHLYDLNPNSHSIPTHFHSKRHKRATKKKLKELNAETSDKPERGFTLDSDDVRKKMQSQMVKLQSQLREIQPKTINTDVLKKIQITESDTSQRKVNLSSLANISMRGTTHISILANNPANNERISDGLRIFNEDFHPKLEKSGLIVITVPRPNEDQLLQLRRAVRNRTSFTVGAMQDYMKAQLKSLKKIREYISKEEYHDHQEALNKLVKEQTKLVLSLETRKLKEFD